MVAGRVAPIRDVVITYTALLFCPWLRCHGLARG